jgi:hypothetical protein
MGVDNSISVEKFCKNFKIEINRLTKDDMEFDMIGIDASMANAFRRILIAEVSACYHVYSEIEMCFLYFSFLYVQSAQAIVPRLNFVSILIGSYYGY